LASFIFVAISGEPPEKEDNIIMIFSIYKIIILISKLSFANQLNIFLEISIPTKGVTVYRYTDVLQYEKINFVPRYDFWKTGIL
jgi:hypothetical protein